MVRTKNKKKFWPLRIKVIIAFLLFIVLLIAAAFNPQSDNLKIGFGIAILVFFLLLANILTHLKLRRNARNRIFQKLFLDKKSQYTILRIFKRTKDPSGLDRFRISRVSDEGKTFEEFVEGIIVLMRGNKIWGWEHIWRKRRKVFIRKFHLIGSVEEKEKAIRDIMSEVIEKGERPSGGPEIVAQVTRNDIKSDVTVVVSTGEDLGRIITAYPYFVKNESHRILKIFLMRRRKASI